MMEESLFEKWRRTHYSSEIYEELDGKDVIVCGWAENFRDLGNIQFITFLTYEDWKRFILAHSGVINIL